MLQVDGLVEGVTIRASPSVQGAITLSLALIPTCIALFAVLFLAYVSVLGANPVWFVGVWLCLAGAISLLGVVIIRSAIKQLCRRQLDVCFRERQCIFITGRRSISFGFSEISRIEVSLEQITATRRRSITGAWMAWLSIWTVNGKRLVLSNEPFLGNTRQAAEMKPMAIANQLSRHLSATVSISNGKCPSAYFLNWYVRRVLESQREGPEKWDRKSGTGKGRPEKADRKR